jgi:hypothetical protein
MEQQILGKILRVVSGPGGAAGPTLDVCSSQSLCHAGYRNAVVTRRLTERVQMAAGYTPQQGFIAGESKRLAGADFSERDRHTGEDHSAHAAGKICKSCGHTIEAGQAARRRGETDWVHDVCPVIMD